MLIALAFVAALFIGMRAWLVHDIRQNRLMEVANAARMRNPMRSSREEAAVLAVWLKHEPRFSVHLLDFSKWKYRDFYPKDVV